MSININVMVEAQHQIWDDDYCLGEKWYNEDHFRYNRFRDEEDPAMVIVPIYDDQNYDLFALLTGITNSGSIPCFGFGRGIPDDADEPTVDAFDRASECYHPETPGYATLDELKQAHWELVVKGETELADGLNVLIEALDERKREIWEVHEGEGNPTFDDRIRIIFWFDN
mgnify:CR=1 FL=1